MTAKPKYAVVFGTRPEAIKLAPVIRAFADRDVPLLKISTGQHLSMLWQALDFFGIGVDHDLGAMREGQTLPELLARIISDVDAVLRRERPDVVIVQGDTSTALGAGLAAYLSRLEVAHVEAGLRTYDDFNPFPEEANRALLSRIARWHFAPTPGARENLVREGVDPARIRVTGNTVVDALQWAQRRIANRDLDPRRFGIPPESLARFVLVTSHRRENFGRGLADICAAICEIEQQWRDLHIIWPVHLNPNVRSEVERLLGACGPRVLRIEPVDYEGMLLLLSRCAFILTDSGGVQEEATVFHKPVLIMRKATERPEVIDAGFGTLVGTDPSSIVRAAERLLNDNAMHRAIAETPNPFGDGHAAERIVDALLAPA